MIQRSIARRRLTAVALLLTALLLRAPASLADKAPSTTAVVMWLGGTTAARMAYETQVVELALEKSRDKYGDYTFSLNAEKLTSQRVERDIRDGAALNILSQPAWAQESAEEDSIVIIPIPISRGLLGYRQLIVRAEDLPRFRKVSEFEDLQQLTAGLGADWVDQEIFRQNRLPIQTGKTTEQLLRMLARGRFDYFPLGVVEIEEVLASSAYRKQLAVVPDLVIHYALPVFIQVSVNRPELVERLTFGLRQAQADGSLEELFKRTYGPVLKRIKAEDPRVISLENTYLPDFAKDTGPILLQNSNP